jgi:hypothetical protein
MIKVSSIVASLVLTTSAADPSFAAFDVTNAVNPIELAENLASCSGQLSAGTDYIGPGDGLATITENTQAALRFILRTAGLQEASYKIIEEASGRKFLERLIAFPMDSRTTMETAVETCRASLKEAEFIYNSETKKVAMLTEAKAEAERRERMNVEEQQAAKKARAEAEAQEARVRLEQAKQLAVKTKTENQNKFINASANQQSSNLKQTAGHGSNDDAPATDVSLTNGGYIPLANGSPEKKAIDKKIADYFECSEYFKAGILVKPDGVDVVEISAMATTMEALAFETARPYYPSSVVYDRQAEPRKYYGAIKIPQYWMYTESLLNECIAIHNSATTAEKVAAQKNWADMHKVIVLK